MTLFVTNQALGTVNPASVAEYKAGSSGGAIPKTTISGGHTGMLDPLGLFVAAGGNIFVANSVGSDVTEYGPSASGNAAPIAIIAGSSTGLAFPTGVTLDSAGNIYVTNGSPINSVAEFPPGTNGDATPSATIQGAATGLGSPNGIVVDAMGKIFVANSAADTITEYAPGSTGNAAPAATISGSGLNGPAGLALDASGNIWIANIAGQSVTEYAAGSNGSSVIPMTTITGPDTLLSKPSGIVVDTSGNVYVSNLGNNSITEFSAGSNDDAPPIVVIEGPKTGLSEPGALAIQSIFPIPTPTPKPTPTPGPVPPGMSLSPDAISFPQIGAGTTPVTKTFTIVNAGADNIEGSVISSGAPFKIVKGKGRFRLAPAHNGKSQKKTVAVQFAPKAPGTFAGNVIVDVTAPDSTSLNVLVSGSALGGALSLSGVTSHVGALAKVDFGSVAVGNSETKTLTVLNKGPGVLTGTITATALSLGGAFQLSPKPTRYTLTKGQTLNLNITFAPHAARQFSGFIAIGSDDPNNTSILVALVGSGQ